MTQSSSTRTSSDPSGKFSSPEEVVEARHLPYEERRSLLQQWRDQLDARGKHGEVHETDLATRLARALSFLDTETGEHKVTHNQGLYTSVRDAGKDQDR
jgi:hypothetical protein